MAFAQRDTAKGTAFVLVGEGSLGAVHVGMLQALSAQGIEPDLLIGSSVGAVNAAWVAEHGCAQGFDDLALLWRSLTRSQLFPLSPVDGVMALLGRGDHLFSPDRLRRFLRNHVGLKRLEAAKIPLHVAVTDIVNGSQLLLSRGDVLTALLATTSVPAVFPPVRISGHEFADGDLAEATPIADAVRLGAEHVYVLFSGYGCAVEHPPTSALGIVLHALSLLTAHRVDADVEQFHYEVDLHVLPTLCPLAISPADFSHGGELIERSRAASADWLEHHSRRSEPEGPSLVHAHDGQQAKKGEDDSPAAF